MEIKQVIKDILTKFKNQSFVIAGVSAKNFPNAVVLPATTPSAELAIIPTEQNCQRYPKWLMTILIKARAKKHLLLCIDRIDMIPFSEQEKFCGLLKYKGLNGFAFPADTQIILTAQNLDHVAPAIKDFCLLYDVNSEQ